MNTKQLRIIFGVIILTLLAFVGYIYFVNNSQVQPQNNSVRNSTTDKAIANWKTYDFNGPVNFSIEHPPTWETKAVKINDYSATLSLTRGSYRINIGQADGGGGECIFSDSGKQPNKNFDVDLRNVSFIEFSTPIGVIRRYPTKSVYAGQEYDFQLTAKTNGAFSCGAYSTPIGGISYDLPKDYDPQVLDEMDSIVKTIKK